MRRQLSYADFYQRAFGDKSDDFQQIADFVSACLPGDILEVGAGTGRTLGAVNGRKHVLLEPDSEMLLHLRGRALKYPTAQVVQARCPELPFEDARFAGLFLAFGTIGEINPICVTLQEVSRVLIPGGRALFHAINPAKYRSPPLGIYRSEKLKNSGFSFVSNTIQCQEFGPGEYQTQIWLRQRGAEQQFTVRQYFPSFENWISMISAAGLQVVNDPESISNSDVFTFLLEKPEVPIVQKKAEIAVIYDQIASQYTEFMAKSDYGLGPWLRGRIALLAGFHPKAIDLACGNGFVGQLYEESGVSVSSLYGYDISAAMLSECRKSRFYSGTCLWDLAKGLPGVAGLSVDLVTAFGLLEFLSDPVFLLRDIRRTLVLGGELLCSFEAAIDSKLEEPVEMSVGGTQLTRYRRSRDYVRSLLRDAGFEDISIDHQHGYTSPTTGEVIDYHFVRGLRRSV